MKTFSFIFLCLLLSIKLNAQNEGNIWYFGYNAGIDFNSGSALALNNGALWTSEGCATICDASGNLLFYTDGSTVYNANHVAMPNGTGLNGNNSSSQSALIVKKPGFTNIYTIFTVTDYGQSDGFQYTEVDMSLQNGLGDVTSTVNVPVYTPTCERLIAVRHQNGIDYWIITQDYMTSNFRSYLYTNAGLASSWVSSNSGVVLSGLGETIGVLKGNPAGNQIAMTINTADVIKLYDFDNGTGTLSNPITLPIISPYGVEFSFSGQFLYCGIIPTFGTSHFYQYNLQAGNAAAIQNSAVLIGQSLSHPGTLQRGPDKKIYGAIINYSSTNTPSGIAVISDPDLQGLNCNFNAAGFQPANNTAAFLGLPNFPNDFFINENQTYHICQGDSVELSSPNFSTFNWAIENNPSNILSTDSILTVSPHISTSYILFSGLDTVSFNITVHDTLSVNLGADTCINSGTLLLDVTQPNVTYQWQDGSNNPTFNVTASGTYWVQISNGTCTSTDSISIQYDQIEIQGDTLITCDSTVNLSLTGSNSGTTGHWTYLAPPGDSQNVVFTPNSNVSNPLITVPELGEYHFIFTSSCGAVDTHTVVFDSQAPVLNINLTQECNFNVNLIASNPIQNGTWTAVGPVGETITITDIHNPNTTAVVSNYGTYTFTYTYNFCKTSSSALIDIQSVQPNITNTKTLYICDKSIDLSAQIPGQAEQWSVEGPGIVTFSNFQSLNTTATVDKYGDYTFYFHGCGGTDTLEVSFIKNAPTIHAPSYVYCGTEALLEVFYYENNTGTWSYKPETDEIITLVELDSNMVSVSSDSYGSVDVTYTTCDTSTTVNIAFMCELDIPNVFSPNNDGINDEFFISRLNTKFYDKSRFVVYDRWGVEVYTNGRYGLEGSWWNGKTAKNGKNLEEGVYYYVLLLHNKINNQEENYHGTVHIFR